MGRAAVLSFNGNKTLTTGGGGMLLTDDDDLADSVGRLANQAREPGLHYEHRELGYNYRMNNLLAAIGRAQLTRLPEMLEARRAVNDRYREAFAGTEGLRLMPRAPYGEPSCWLTCLEVDDTAFGTGARAICERLSAEGIEARPTWKPMHLQPLFHGARMVGGAVCERLYARGLCLPSGSSLTESQQERVVEAVLAAGRTARGVARRHAAGTGGATAAPLTARETCTVASKAATQ